MKNSLVILAAGNSSRFPEHKLLYKIDKTNMLEIALQKGKKLPVSKRYVIAQHEEIKKLALSYGYEIIHNKHPEKGISHSIVLAVKSCEEDDGILFVVADQPWLNETTLQMMLEKADENHIICVGNYGEFQNPMLFPQHYFEELLELQGDKGAKKIAYKHKEKVICVSCEKDELLDFDTKKELEEYILKKFG